RKQDDQVTSGRKPRTAKGLQRLFAVGLLAFTLGTATVAFAQTTTEQPSPVEALALELDQLTAALKRDDLDESRLGPIRERATEILLKANTIGNGLAPAVAAAEKRLQELAPEKTKEGETEVAESDAVKSVREAQEKELADLQGAVKRAHVIKLKAQEVLNSVVERRRNLFFEKLTTRSYSILNPILWVEATERLPQVLSSLGLLASDWIELVASRGAASAGLLIAIAVVFGLVLASPLRRWMMRGALRRAAIVDPDNLNLASAATWIVLVNAAAPALAVLIVGETLEELSLLPERIESTFLSLLVAIGMFGLIFGLGRAILAPTRPHWRLARLPNANAERLFWIVIVIGAIFSVTVLAVNLAKVLVAPVATTIAITGVSSFVIAVLTLIGLRTTTRGLIAERLRMNAPERSTWSVFLPIWWITALVIVVAALFGYLALGWFLATQIVWTTVVLGSLGVFLMLTDAVFATVFEPTTRLGVTLVGSMGFSERGVRQVGVVFSGIVRLLLIALAAILLLIPWGFESSDLLGSIRMIFSGITVGGITLSFTGIFVAAIIFIAGVLVTRTVQGWLDAKFLPQTSLDVGLKNSIVTGFGYVGIVIAAMLTVSQLGLDLENVAIVAGALSVGIGFGLQSVVNNFVSGLILLAERPIKTGDWIVVGAEQGYVRRINVRATEIETFDRSTVIVPNSDLISGVVKNWMHADTIGRIKVPVGVSYNADPKKVAEILLKCGAEHPMVLAYPEPRAYFLDFGASSLDFDLRCYLSNIDYALAVASDLRFAIFRELKEAGIEIPFPQRDIHIRNVEEVGTLVAKARGSTPATKRRRRQPDEVPVTDNDTDTE
ncbi:MAG: mechanosensitive ion channel family protein, partial [Hyphomicrobiales bacterium]|nr:mechanosensitive ion channel family protein [Hyphomicrobiales bacterium]